MIEFRKVSYTYPKSQTPALRGLSLEIPEGSFVLVIGPSGAGKSTFLRTLNGLVPRFYGGRWSGSLRVAGLDPVEVGPEGMAEAVGFVGQDPEAHFVAETVEQELAFTLENFGVPRPLMRKRVEEVLDQLKLSALRHRRIETLSGGEKQRTAIASVMTLQPKVLVLDEPTSQIDPQGAEEVLTLLRQLNEDLGLTVVVSEQRLERVAQYADYILAFPGSGEPPVWGHPRDVLAEVDYVPPLVALGKALGWQPLPLTQKEARKFASGISIPENGSHDTPPKGEVAVRLEKVHFGYSDEDVLRGISLEIRYGEVLALMGRNGVGKTTLLKLVVGLLKPRKGQIERWAGGARLGDSLDEIIQVVGYVPQDPTAIFFSDTVREEIAFTLGQHGLPTAPPKAIVDALALEHVLDRYPRDLSGGEKQRAAIAAMTAHDPDVILMDEPTRGLDYLIKEELTNFLRSKAAEGKAVVMATHDTELVGKCADRVVILGNGEIVADGPVREVMTGSMVFSTQINKLFHSPRFLTVEDVLSWAG